MKKLKKNSWSDSDVEAHWDRVANIYVQENNKVKDTHDQRFYETVLHLDLQPDSTILNITSRDGEANAHVLKHQPGVSIVNAEISSGLMDVASKLQPDIQQVKLSTYSNLPFYSNQFTRIICLETLEHVADPVAFLNELYRVSTPDARLVLSCPPATSEIPYQVFTFLFGGHGEGPHRFLPSREVKALFKETGWKLILHKGTVLLPVGPKVLRNAAEKLMEKLQGTFISEFGIRQFYVCTKY
ncbi:MAG: class I SAM-dependent methyltransferase [Lentimicrobiaceae bacterium]|nr:class I SAM-dependent methyltransferase [Lentimicrobiaceae bacterium]MCB9023623.1 class I SAM-dependent methyltransferase [Lentimicrobiaceae bacterium]MCO5264342.1 class I SAM-dependent methyltransferase [Lentimicrobium sp.]HPG34312.1 methyltransferase domain-containing protein [Lentimicrobium sp.]